GSVFRLSMMLASVALPEPGIAPERKIVGYQGAEKTLLVVDDDPTHRGLISEILTPVGFEVLEAEDAGACIRVLQQTPVDLLLMDISMPGMTGWQLLRQLRNDGVSSPVVMVSADAEDRQSALAQGDASDPAERLNNGYLIKPIRDRKLLDMVARVLQLQWQYDDDASELSAPSGADPVDMTLSEAREMLAAAEVGHIVGMEAVLEQMEQR
ncbi:response regulator, partial [Wenyingzhuangia sp. 1_MG-2023]|nr:response regulator [Wenyingzhuangia sp. 1_MG-2023]